MRLPGRTERRLALLFVMVATIPLVSSIIVARYLTNFAISVFYNAEVVGELERSLGVYNELAQAMKAGLRAKADAIAAQEPLRAAAILRHGPSIEQELASVFKMYPDIVSITILTPRPEPDAEPAGQPDDEPDEPGDERPAEPKGKAARAPAVDEVIDETSQLSIGHRDRGFPINEATERKLEVVRPLDKRDGGPTMKVVFAAPRATLDNITHASDFLQQYRLLSREKRAVERWSVRAYALLVGITALGSVVLGAGLARQVTRRIASLARATQDVGAGDLSVRVPVEGEDELGELARAFNRMLGELSESRARVEFLGRMGTWQEMARRLAHEIKNPLTPIQLAVQECHRRYDGDSRSFRKLLDTTLEIVEEEVGTLRRLVTEFSSFARLPRAELAEGDIGSFLQEQQSKLELTEGDDEAAGLLSGVEVTWALPSRPLLVAFDAHLMHRVLVNLTANAAQAIRGAGVEPGKIRVTAAEQSGVVSVEVDDNGPGIPADLRARIFDPYFTTKSDGNGLGLAIVKKIIVEHGGTIEAAEGPLGGARLTIRLPCLGTAASLVALSHSGGQSPPSGPSSGP